MSENLQDTVLSSTWGDQLRRLSLADWTTEYEADIYNRRDDKEQEGL